MSYKPAAHAMQPWEAIPELAPVRQHLAAIARQAERGWFDPNALDALLEELVRQLHAMHRSRDLEHALSSASRMLAHLEEQAAVARSHANRGYDPWPGKTSIAQVIAERGQRTGSTTPIRTSRGTTAESVAPGVGPASPDRFANLCVLNDRSVKDGTVRLNAWMVHRTPLGIGLAMGASATIGAALFCGLMMIWAILSGNIFGIMFWVSSIPLAAICAVAWGFVVSTLMTGRVVNKVRRETRLSLLGADHPLQQEVSRVSSAICLWPPPDIGVYPEESINGFAVGRSWKSSLIGVSEGAMRELSPGEMSALLAHEIGHIASGDMLRMIFANSFQQSLVFWLMFSPLQRFGRWLFSTMGEMAVLALSRAREYRADAFGAVIAGKANMIAMLRKLDQVPSNGRAAGVPAELSFRDLGERWFSTHPPTGHRIAMLEIELYIRLVGFDG